MLRLTRGAVMVLLSAVPAFGQFATAEFNGSVVDQSGAALPGVTVTLTEETTGLVRTVVSNDTGRFALPAMLPGRYTMKTELSGFQTQSRTGLALGVGQAITINFRLPVGTLADQITITSESPLIEVTQTAVVTNVSAWEIDNLPTKGREAMDLMQMIPGLLMFGADPGANGRDTFSSSFLVDGAPNKDDRAAAFSQVTVTQDSMAEFQVLTHNYGAEYGGASGVIVNAVTKSGTNQFHGRGFYYRQDDSLNATNYFLKQRGEKNPESGNDVLGGSIGGPIVRNKAFLFFNYQRQWVQDALALEFPPEAAPLATSFSDIFDVNLTNYFARVDYQLHPRNNLSFRIVANPNDGIGEVAVEEQSLRENFRYERAMERLASASWTAALSSRMLNEVRVSSTYEALKQAARDLYNDEFTSDPFDPAAHVITGLEGTDPLDLGSQQQHPSFRAGPRAGTAGHYWNTIAFTEQFTFMPGNHVFRFGVGASSNGGTSFTAPAGVGGPFGQFTFLTDRNFDPADPFTYPTRFRIRLGDMFFKVEDWRTNGYVSDKWQATDKLTLNLGVRYDYSNIVPDSKDAVAPRLGVAYATSDTMVFRGGVGKFYEPPRNQFMYQILGNSVIGSAYSFDTGNDRSATRGERPAHRCLNPVGDGAGRAAISPDCRAMMVDLRNKNAAGEVFVDIPLLRGTPRLGYLWSWSVGTERQVVPNVAVSVDYVGNVGHDQTGAIDINEGPLGPDGEVTRLGIDVFDPTGTLIPSAARGVNFRRVLQYQTRDVFNTDYQGLELSVVKRMANRWSGRASYSLSRARDVNAGLGNGFAVWDRRVNDDYGVTSGLNPRADYDLANENNRHVLSAGGNWDAWRGLGIGATFRYYSGFPANELVGDDINSDLDGFDRPVQGRDDATMPIVSQVDASGRAIRNSVPGSDYMSLNLRLQYVLRPGAARSLGFYWEIYNLTNRANFANPEMDRASSQFDTVIEAGEPRTMQLGLRYAF